MKLIGMPKNEKWFTDRIGQIIVADSPSFCGPMKIEDAKHASYLCHCSQRLFGFTFRELRQPEENKK